MVQLGCGITGLVCAELLEQNPKVDEIVLSDSRLDAAKAMAARVKSDKVSLKRVEATDPKELRRLLKGCDIVVSSLPWLLNRKVLDTAASMGVNYVDFCLAMESIEEFSETARMCKAAGITALTATGEDPGMSDVFARHGANLLDVAEETRVMDGDNGSAEGYNFFSLWSPVDLMEEVTVPAAVFRNGKMTYVPPLHEREIYEFPPPIGPLPVYKTLHEETFLMPKFIKGVKNASFRIAIDDEFANAAKMLRKLGLHGLKPIDVKGAKVKPLDVVVALMPRPVDLAGKVKGYAGIVVEVIGKKSGKKTMVKTWTTMSHEEAWRLCRSNATGYLVGLGGAVATEMLIAGEVNKKGLLVPEQLDAERYIARLRKRGLKVHQTITTQ